MHSSAYSRSTVQCIVAYIVSVQRLLLNSVVNVIKLSVPFISIAAALPSALHFIKFHCSAYSGSVLLTPVVVNVINLFCYIQSVYL